MFVKTVVRQGEKILQQDKQIKDLQKENNFLYQENKNNRYTMEELEDYKFILNYENSVSTKELFSTLKKHKVQIKADIQADITEMRIEEAKQGQGIGYVMKEATEEAIKNKEVYEVELPIPLPEMKINLVYMEKYLTKMDKIFIRKYLKE